MRDQPIECLHWRLTATGSRPVPEGKIDTISGGETNSKSHRLAYMASINEQVKTNIFSGEDLAEGDVLEGPSVVEFETTTVVINPGDSLTVQPDGSSLITIGEG